MQSYNDIYESMKERYVELTGNEPDNASDIGVRLKVLAGELYASYVQLDWLKRQMFPSTALGEYLDLHAQQRGLVRKSAQKAEGSVTFTLPYTQSTNVEIPQGTVVSTSGSAPVYFETTSSATITAGQTSVNAPIAATEAGARGNVAANAITLMVTPIGEVSLTGNAARTENGTDEESDDSLRRRVLDSFVNIQNGTNKAYYLAQALSVDGVTAASVVPRARGAGTVNVYITDSDGSPSASLISEVQDKLSLAREINVDVEVAALRIIPLNVYMYLSVKSGYEYSVVCEECKSAIRAYFSSLGGGETVYLSEIGESFRHIEGVKNYSFIHQLVLDTPIPPDSVARCGTISVSERE